VLSAAEIKKVRIVFEKYPFQMIIVLKKKSIYIKYVKHVDKIKRKNDKNNG